MKVKLCTSKRDSRINILIAKETKEALCMIGQIKALEEDNVIEYISGEDNPNDFMAIYSDGNYTISSDRDFLIESVTKLYSNMDYDYWKKNENKL